MSAVLWCKNWLIVLQNLDRIKDFVSSDVHHNLYSGVDDLLKLVDESRNPSTVADGQPVFQSNTQYEGIVYVAWQLLMYSVELERFHWKLMQSVLEVMSLLF